MPAIPQTGDLTKAYLSLQRQIEGFRPIGGTVYPIGSCVKLASLDQQVYPDYMTVTTPSTGTGQQLIVGVVAEVWPGFDGNGATTAPGNNARGSSDVDVVTIGPHPAILVDQSGTGAAAITNEIPLVPSRASAGYTQGVASPVAALGTVAVANLPASGVCSNLTAAALAQATCTDTVAGVPAAGDVLVVTVQTPDLAAAPGTTQTRSVTTTLTAGSAASVTTAAAAVVAACNADPVYAKYYVASNAAGVVTHTVVQGATWLRTFAINGVLASSFTFTVSGSAMNGATHTNSVSGASTFTSSGNFAAGAGFRGTIPGFVI